MKFKSSLLREGEIKASKGYILLSRRQERETVPVMKIVGQFLMTGKVAVTDKICFSSV